jgi:Arylsulfotransferase (ASST)
MSTSGLKGLGVVIAALLVSAVAILSSTSGVHASSAPVDVFPIPGSRAATPQTQITVRGVPSGQLGAITVVGSRSGAHSGKVLSDSDGRGGSFVPDKPFTAGETVTVSTSLSIVGASNGSYRFTVATPAGPIRYFPLPPAPRVRNDVLRFHSRPDLAPAAVAVRAHATGTAPGDIFIAPQQGPIQNGPMIVDQGGGLIWFMPVPGRNLATDFRVQTLAGQPVLTWWQGYLGAGVGVGEDLIYNTSYQKVATVRAGNGLNADVHEFQLTPQGTALITAYFPVYSDASSMGGSRHAIVLDSVVQELDIHTGLVLFQWDSLDHVLLTDSYSRAPASANAPYDYFHVNSVDQDLDGNLVISARNTWAAYKLSHQTGAVIWRLGGKHSSFKMGPGARSAFQHDVRVRAGNDLFVTSFDDGAGPPTVHSHSRGLKLILDLKHMTARWVAELDHTPQLVANFEGNMQQLPNGDNFVGWGQQPFFSEFNPRNRLIFDGRFVGANSTYRAYRLPWTGTPTTPPAVAATSTGNHTSVYTSWNGATNVASWRVLGGGSPSALRPVATASKHSFETAITIPTEQYVQAQALDGSGNVVSSSSVVRSG